MKVISSLGDFLSTYARLQPEVADLLVAFGLATWFCDCMSVAPVLYLFGPESAVSQVLRLLGCFCRRPVLLGDVDFEGLSTLPSRLGATLLINQRDLGRRVKRSLLASNRRHFCLARGRKRLDLYGAKAFSCADSRGDEHGLRASVPPAQDRLPFLTDSEEQIITQSFQARLLRYRMVHYETVRDREVDCSSVVPEMREEASTWLAPISDCGELLKSVFEEILRQSRNLPGLDSLIRSAWLPKLDSFSATSPMPHTFLSVSWQRKSTIFYWAGTEIEVVAKEGWLAVARAGIARGASRGGL